MKRMKRITLLLVCLVAFAFAQDDFKRERSGAGDALKNSGEGKAPPEWVADKWLNTPDDKPLDWKSLKGKVVLLDLWAYW